MEQAIGERQRWVWLISAGSAAAAVLLCGFHWLWVLLGGFGVCLYYLYIEKKLGTDGLAQCMTEHLGIAGKVLAMLTIFWLVALMGYCACLADSAFPMVDGFPGLGWVLLALTAWGSAKGARACAACSGILCLFLLTLYGVVVIFSVPDVELSYLLPDRRWPEAVAAAGVFLLPAGVWMMSVRERKGGRCGRVVILPALAAILSATAAGVLSPELARISSVPLYEVARSVSVLGVVERIEPLLSAAMTMGVFCLLTSLACACQSLADGIGTGRHTGSVCALAAAGVMFGARYIPGLVIVGGNLLFFLVFPVVCVNSRKN